MIVKMKKVSLVIWANHLIRGAIQKMQEITAEIYREENLLGVEDKVVPVKEVFRLQDDAEIAEAEKRYLQQKSGKSFSATILAATQGVQLGNLTQKIPKTMLKIGNRTILDRIIDHLHDFDINDINLVAGFGADTIEIPNLNITVNDSFKTSGQMVSLSKSNFNSDSDNLIIFGDILFRRFILQFVIDDPADIVLIADSSIHPENESKSDFIISTEKDNQSYFGEDVLLKHIDFTKPDIKYHGEWIGILKLSTKGTQQVLEFIKTHQDTPEFQTMDIRDMINAFIKEGTKVKVQYISGHWVDVNNITDLTSASEF